MSVFMENNKPDGDESVMSGVHKFCSENQVDVVRYGSGSGARNVVDISHCRNADEAYAVLNEAKRRADADHTGASDIFQSEPWEGVGRQGKTIRFVVDGRIPITTQFGRVVLCDLEDTWLGAEEYVAEDGSKRYRKRSYETLITIRDDDGAPIRRLTAKEFVELVERVSITNMSEDYRRVERKFETKEKMSAFLLDQLERTYEFPFDLRDAVRLNEDGDFNVPLDAPQVLPAVGKIISRYIRRNVIERKVKGCVVYPCAPVGLPRPLRQVWGTDEVSGQPYVRYIECMMPAWSEELYMAFADRDGNIDIDKIPNHLKELVGYCEPTVYMNTMLPLRVVGFLPQEMGGVIMLPQETTVRFGSRFGDDPILVEVPEFKWLDPYKLRINETKETWVGFYWSSDEVQQLIRKAWIKAIEQDMYSDDGAYERQQLLIFRDYVEHKVFTDRDFEANDKDWYSLNVEEAREAFGDIATAFAYYRKVWCDINGRGRGCVLDVLSEEEYKDVSHDYQLFLEKTGCWEGCFTSGGDTDLFVSSTQEELDRATRMARNNFLIRLHFSRLTSDHTLMALNIPGGCLRAKKLARVMRCLVSGRVTTPLSDLLSLPLEDRNGVCGLDSMVEEYAEHFEFSDPCYDDVMFERYMPGKNTRELLTLHHSFHALIQRASVHLSDEFKKTFPIIFNGVALDEVGAVRSVDGSSIVRTLGCLLTASYENEDEPVIGDLGLTARNANYALTLLHLGYSLETAILFINQPIIKRLFREFEISGAPWYKFKKYFFDNIRGVRYDCSVALSDDDMQAAITNLAHKKLKFAELKFDTFQFNVLAMFCHVFKVTYPLLNLIDMTKISSPKYSMGDSIGDTYMRMQPIRKRDAANSCFNYRDTIHVFNVEEYNNIVRDDNC